jgi:tripartite-type tricarboxylate transporter receptor subunit TctC
LRSVVIAVGTVVGFGTMSAVAQAAAGAYPSRPVRMLLPLLAGGGMDVIARGLAARLTESLGQNFIVDNRPGAGGSIALEISAAAPPDGHTLVVISATSLTHPILYASRIDVVRDFAPVAQLTAQGYVLAVHPSMPARTVLELVQHLRAYPGKVNFASSGVGSPIHLTGELFMAATGTRMVHVPYKGMGGAYADMIAGHIDLSFPTILSSLPHVRAGKLRGLAVTGPNRLPALPDLPTITEAGVPGVVVTNWYAMLAPKGTPTAVVDRLNAAIQAAMSRPETMKRLLADGSAAATGSPDQLRAHLHAEHERWTRVIRAAGIRGE